jgi:uncharacterized protein YndB with AHSA1/START domain
MDTSMKTVSITGVINASPHSVWSVIRNCDNVDRWAPGITACKLQGSAQVGATRVCSMGDQQLVESIETIDDPSRLFQYRITQQAMMPIRNPLGTVHIAEAPNGKAHVLWMLNFEMLDEQAWPMVKENLSQLYRAGLAGLEKFAASR